MGTVRFEKSDFVSTFSSDDCYSKRIEIMSLIESGDDKIVLDFEDLLSLDMSRLDKILHPIFDQHKFDWLDRLETCPSYRMNYIIDSIHSYFEFKFMSVKS